MERDKKMTQLAQKLQSVVQNPLLSQRDREFARSLEKYYEKNRKLSTGRRRCLAQLEARAESLKSVNVDRKTLDRLNRLAAKVEGNAWATDFVTSLTDRIGYGRELTPAQINRLGQIEEEYSDAAVEKKAKFAREFSPEMRARMNVAAEYYVNNPPYYGDLIKQIGDDEDFIPSEKQWRSMVENKYASKVWENYTSPPKYPVGTCVQLRKSSRVLFCHQSKMGFVVEAGQKVPVTSAKGGKIYLILPVGEITPIYCEERDLKLYRKKKKEEDIF